MTAPPTFLRPSAVRLALVMCLTKEPRLTPEYCFAKPYVAAPIRQCPVRRCRRGEELTQRMVDTGRVVAHALGRPLADKDAAGVEHLVHGGLGRGNLQDQVLGRVLVA